MKRFKNILLVLHGEAKGNASLKRALRVAQHNDSQLSVIDVVERFPSEMRKYLTDISPGELQAIVKAQRLAQLERLIAPFREEGLDVEAQVLVGTPFIEIIHEVLRRKHDLLIKTAEGKAGPLQRLFGSTDMHLLRKCPCPVWVVKPTERKQYARILAAVDPDPSDEVRTALNVLIIELATSLARMEQSELHVVHAWRLEFESMLRSGRARVSTATVDKMALETEQTHKKWIEDMVAKVTAKDLVPTVHLFKGEPGDLIPELAQKKRVQLIVMGTVARVGIPGFFIGNTAEKVLAKVDCSVLALKPKEFITPVHLEKLSENP